MGNTNDEEVGKEGLFPGLTKSLTRWKFRDSSPTCRVRSQRVTGPSTTYCLVDHQT